MLKILTTKVCKHIIIIKQQVESECCERSIQNAAEEVMRTNV